MPELNLEDYWKDVSRLGGGLSASVREPGTRLEMDWDALQRLPECIYYPTFTDVWGFRLWELRVVSRETLSIGRLWKAVPRRLLWGRPQQEDSDFLGVETGVYEEHATENLGEAVTRMQLKADELITVLTRNSGGYGDDRQHLQQIDELRALDFQVLLTHPLENLGEI